MFCTEERNFLLPLSSYLRSCPFMSHTFCTSVLGGEVVCKYSIYICLLSISHVDHLSNTAAHLKFLIQFVHPVHDEDGLWDYIHRTDSGFLAMIRDDTE